ncbi:alpha/beta hydrolase family protein [Kitasatospora sp. NPDC059571]|uniref:alpha/beta hydrolase family protein n=1 Tax=Kitasatospora sp. NPDC059571 TaxID=3346871 RepID=UPI0036BEB4D2
MTTNRIRRSSVAAASVLLALAGPFAAPAAHADPATTTRPVAMTLPAPHGPHAVGTTGLHLVDASRKDPWQPGHSRELMVTLWYPARPGQSDAVAPQLPAGTAAAFAASLQQQFGLPTDTADWAGTETHSRTDAPAQATQAGLPVVLYSPGATGLRGQGTVLAEELASRGYLVVAIDHTYESLAVEFPDGRVALPDPAAASAPPSRLVDIRVADARFVLDRLTLLNAGGNPDADHRRLPTGLTGRLDLCHVGMIGHSLGGATAAQVMHDDARVEAAVDLDGGLDFGDQGPVGSVVADGLDRPFLLMNSAQWTHNDPWWQPFWANLRGMHRNIQLAQSAHLSYTDLQVQLPQIAAAGRVPEAAVQSQVGTIDPTASITTQRAYVDAFFDLTLRHRDDHLLDGPSSRFPQATFVK